jgi:hypothetical protein
MTIAWKPIESAPKDETLILLYFPTGRGDEDRYKIGFWSPDGDWFDSEAASNSLTCFGDQPSHWAALNTP